MDQIGDKASWRDSRSDSELVSALNAGEDSAFEVLYYRHRDWVAGLAFRFTRDHDLALDILQETFLYLTKKFPGFRLTANLKTFLYPVVRHLSITAQRRTRRLQSSPAEMEELECSVTSAPAIAENEALHLVVAGLSEDHREVLLLRFIDGFSLAEIGNPGNPGWHRQIAPAQRLEHPPER